MLTEVSETVWFRSKAKKKEKRKREPRFAFLTKSEVDHLEDGYRWRKYGQKAVKNSPYPRSYYRCTTQKCIVKKRVERSFQDSSTVITTYEGQHNHQCPATLRGNLNLNAVGMLSPNSLLASASLSGSARFSHEFLAQFLPMDNQLQLQSHQHDHPPSSTLYSTLMSPHRHHHNQQQQQLPASDYGLLQDLVPSFSHKKEPWIFVSTFRVDWRATICTKTMIFPVLYVYISLQVVRHFIFWSSYLIIAILSCMHAFCGPDLSLFLINFCT